MGWGTGRGAVQVGGGPGEVATVRAEGGDSRPAETVQEELVPGSLLD